MQQNAPLKSPSDDLPASSLGRADRWTPDRLRERLADLPPDSRKTDLRDADLSGLDLTGFNLEGCDLSGANLSGARLLKARLRGANLTEARLDNAERAGADLRECCLERISAVRAGLGMSDLRRSRLFEADLKEATLSMANLKEADLRCARLGAARLREAGLEGADLTRAQMGGADLEGARVERAHFNEADLRGARLAGIEGYESAQWIGVDLRDVHFAGAYLMRRFVLDQNFLAEFRSRGKAAEAVYYLWWITSDCGRSLIRWCLWTAGLVGLFAWLYTLVGMDYGDYPTTLSPLYYSVVTLTTLGYGDVLPASQAAQVVAMLEVLAGYVMLGGLLSIFNNRMTRRAD